jgi:ketosteroid isomerase-like protein
MNDGKTNDVSKARRQVVAVENARYAAMIAADTEALDRILDEELTYVHSSGISDTKRSYLSGLENGAWNYRGIDRSNTQIVVKGDTATVLTSVRIDLVASGIPKIVSSRVLAVYINSPEGWRLLSALSSPADC